MHFHDFGINAQVIGRDEFTTETRRHGGNQYFKALKEEMLLSQTGKLFVTLSSCLRASVVQQSKGKCSAGVPYE